MGTSQLLLVLALFCSHHFLVLEIAEILRVAVKLLSDGAACGGFSREEVVLGDGRLGSVLLVVPIFAA